jgi:phosphatidylinositol alpha-1,6-mannosyltransferase
LTIISSTENLGFAGGHNLAIGMALQSDTPYVLMLNSDIVVDSDFLAPLVAEVEPSDTCAAGPVVLCGEGRDTIWQAGGSINLATGGTRRNRAGEPLEVLGGETRAVSYLPGCAVLLKARALRDVGNLDSAYFLYYEDTDWFARAGRLGWKAVLVPQSKVWHKETPLSTQAKSLYSSYYFARNRLQFVRRNRPACLAVALIWSLRYGLLNNAARRRWLELGMSLRGIRDFLRGKRGRCEEATPEDVSLPNFLVFSVDYKPQPGGIAEHSHRVALGLRQAGTGVVVLASSFKGWREFDRNQPFHTYRVPRVKFLDLILHLFVGLYVIIKHRVGVIYVATSNPCAALCFLMRQVVSFKCGVTIHAHEVLYGRATSRQKLKLLLRPLQIAMISRADRVFAVSEFTRQLLIKAGVASAKIFKIYNGVDLEELDGTMDTGPVLDRFGLRGKRIILTVARLDIHKGQDAVIKALPSIIAEVPDAVYVVVGDGAMRPHLVALSETLGVSDHVVLAGGLPRPEVIALFKACDVFAMISRIERGSVEGFGIAFLEAGALGKPVVGGRSGGIPDAVEDGLTGLLVDPTSPEEVAGAISRILLDHDLAARFGAAGSRRARSLFTWEKTIERILDGLNAPVT